MECQFRTNVNLFEFKLHTNILYLGINTTHPPVFQSEVFALVSLYFFKLPFTSLNRNIHLFSPICST